MLRMVTALALFFELRGHLAAGVHWFTRRAGNPTGLTVLSEPVRSGEQRTSRSTHTTTRPRSATPEALAMAEATGDTWTEARALNTFGYAEVFLDPSRSLATLQRSIALGREIDDAWAIADGLKMLSVALMTQHALDLACAAIDELRVAADELDNLFFRAWYRTGNGFIALYRGDIGTARREFELALDDCRAVGDPSTGSIASSWLAEVDVLAGEWDAAARRLDALNRPATVDDFPADEPTVIASAGLALRLGDAHAALAELGKLAFADDGLVIPIWAAWSSMLRGEAHMAVGDDDAAAAALEAARRHAGPPLDNPWLAASIQHHLGVLARRRGQARDSERLHHEALAVRQQHGFLPGIVESLEALAQLAADCESFRESARLLAAASNFRASNGLARPPAGVDRVRRVRGPPPGCTGRGGAWRMSGTRATPPRWMMQSRTRLRGRGERKRPSSGWDALTPMENQVVALAAEGLTNPQIAERLFVARGTVKIHLSHIFSKLGVSTGLNSPRPRPGARPPRGPTS